MIFPNAKALTLTAPLALAALLGPKTRTMRPMSYQMPWAHHVEPLDPAKWGKEFPGAEPGNSTWLFQDEEGPLRDGLFNVIAPPWKPGDVLWLREPGRVVDYVIFEEGNANPGIAQVKYLSDGEIKLVTLPTRLAPEDGLPAWLSRCRGIPNGIFREAARAFFEVTAAWPMRVQDITPEGVDAEGVEQMMWELRGKYANTMPQHWMSDDGTEIYCRACALKERALRNKTRKPGAPRIEIEGGNNGMYYESDGLEYCSTCGRLLDSTPLDIEEYLPDENGEYDGAMSEEEVAMYVGYGNFDDHPGLRREVLRCAWDSLYIKRGLGWDANPLCWAYTFKRLENAA